MDEQPIKEQAVPSSGQSNWRGREFVRVILISFACLVLLAGAVIGYFYASSPISIREPLLEHYHFRMQVLVNGKAEKFNEQKYQTPYSKDNCNVALPDSPIHFHDNKDQFVHIHWEGMTGGQVLKYYGWNFIGGIKHSLGYRFDNLPKLKNVPIHGQVLPTIPDNANFYVYTADGEGYKEKNFDDFTHQDLEQFFGKTSNFPAHKLNQQKRSSWLGDIKDQLLPTAHAAQDTGSHAQHDKAELTRTNNLVGDVIIFAQKDKPTDQQIKDRFDRLEPLSDSTCGG